MATRAELIYDIKEYLKKYSDDSDIPSRYIMYLYKNKRARNLRQVFNDTKKSFDASMVQSLCMEVEGVSNSVCGIDLPCKIVRTKKALPNLLDLRNRNSLLYVGPSVHIAESFKLITLPQLPYIFDRPYSNGIFSFIDEQGFIYLISKKKSLDFLECLYVKGVFEDPESLSDFKNCCGDCGEETSCFTDDTPYPLQPFLIETIRAEIIKELASREQIPEDKENNADDK